MQSEGKEKSHQINKRPNSDAATLTIVFSFATLSLQSFHVHNESPIIKKVVFFTAQESKHRAVNKPTSSDY